MPTIYFETLDDETVAVQGEVGDVLMEVAHADDSDVSETSRLSCQIELTNELDGLMVRVVGR